MTEEALPASRRKPHHAWHIQGGIMNRFAIRASAWVGLAALTCAALPSQAQAPAFTRPIRVVVANAAGGNTDLVTRMATEGMARELGHSAYVENLVGGRQIPGTMTVARSPADGQTLLAIGLTFAVNAGLY